MAHAKKILVVDDEEVLRVLYEDVFTARGFSVKTVASAEEALEVIQKEAYPVMFLDLNLPGMNGVELCRQVKNISPLFITYAITGYVSIYEVLSCRDAGFDDYFTKPIDMELLCEVAERAFEKLERWTKKPVFE